MTDDGQTPTPAEGRDVIRAINAIETQTLSGSARAADVARDTFYETGNCALLAMAATAAGRVNRAQRSIRQRGFDMNFPRDTLGAAALAGNVDGDLVSRCLDL